MKRLLIALALTAFCSVTAIAGDIPTSDYVPPPPGQNGPASTTQQGQLSVSEQALPESDPASLDPMQSLLLTILSLLAR